MKITIPFEKNTLPDRYGKKGQVTAHNYAVVSFPFSLEDLPEGTQTLAWTLVDHDALPVCGFSYIHWVVANAPVQTDIAEDFSRQDQQHTHGKNSLVSKFMTTDYSDIDEGYMGPYPPDKDHAYTLTVYALDEALDLPQGFYMNDLLHAIEGHVLEQASLDVIGRA